MTFVSISQGGTSFNVGWLQALMTAISKLFHTGIQRSFSPTLELAVKLKPSGLRFHLWAVISPCHRSHNVYWMYKRTPIVVSPQGGRKCSNLVTNQKTLHFWSTFVSTRMSLIRNGLVRNKARWSCGFAWQAVGKDLQSVICNTSCNSNQFMAVF